MDQHPYEQPQPQSAAACPGCGRTWVEPVREAVAGQHGSTLATRLAPAPAGEDAGDWSTVLEALVFVGAGLAGAGWGLKEHHTGYLIGGLAAAALGVSWFFIRRSAKQSNARIGEGRIRADRVWDTGWWCHHCELVFSPAASWNGMLTPEQFQEMVWTAGGYAEKLPRGDR
jgi:hypothetical protein